MTQFHLPAAFVERLGWVLVHSVWQFALIALTALVLQRAMQRTSAATRYWVLLLALGTMLAAPVATWLAIPHEEAHPFHLAYPPALRDWPPLVAFRDWLREEIDLSHRELHVSEGADPRKPKRIRSSGRSRRASRR